MNRPPDLKVSQAIEQIFALNSADIELAKPDTGLKSRTLLGHWPLSRVERIIFRSEELPSVILKAVAQPLQGELTVYQDLFQDPSLEEQRWTPRLYGSTSYEGDLWLFLEDVGPRTLKNEPTPLNLLRAIQTLASFHVYFGREVANGSLQQRSSIPVRDYSNYLSGARHALVLTRALVNKNLFTEVTPRHLAQLESIANIYDRVAIGLMGAPQTLVHGDYTPENIALSRDGSRIIVLDWGDAHIGSAMVDLVDLATFATSRFGPDMLPRILQEYQQAYSQARGEQLASEPLEELFVCSQIEKMIGMIRWYCQCSLKWIPSGVAAYNHMVAGLIEEAYELSTVLL
ncbi:MAG TPA: aminoglycoside phosphotransferase family protein [Chloroflexia bacterium]|nr:aminoglycoside phosphotransferase family protein [Chloroflexia bacterium]